MRTFAVITTDSNELVADIHDRMPVILAPADYARWLSEEPDPVCRQSISDNWLGNLRECLAHLV